MTIRIATIVGARPQFIKAGALSRQLGMTDGIEEIIIHTGQHFDDNMSAIFFKELGIPTPAYNLDIHGGGHGEMTGRMLEKIEQILLKEQPDMLLIYGDTNSTLAGALAASKMHIPVAHVEAGLRSFNRKMPEELNRIVADHMSDLLFCSTSTSIENLKNEGITSGVCQVGDVMYDATLHIKSQAMANSTILEQLKITEHGYNVCTLHRAENTDSPELLKELIEFLEAQSQAAPTVFPVHPRTRAALNRDGLVPKNLMLIDPVGYLDLNRLLAGASAVFTDSGGLQKEAYFHRVPCVTLRSETEWVETIEAGWNRLWKGPDFVTPKPDISEYGTGNASKLILEEIQSFLTA